jgi:CheY-like chemotaxis protein
MPHRKNGTILVVDDDHDILDAITEALEREGYRVVAAHNGLGALTALRAEPVDLILLDLLMPTMNGWEFLESSADDPRITSTPLIVVSAAPHEVEPGPHIRAILPKPFVRGALLELVATHIRPPA